MCGNQRWGAGTDSGSWELERAAVSPTPPLIFMNDPVSSTVSERLFSKGGKTAMSPRMDLHFRLVLVLVLIPWVSGRTLPTAEASQPAQSQYRLERTVLGAAGASGSSAGFKSAGTLGQPTPTGLASAADKRLSAGFWMIPANPASLPGKTPGAFFANGLYGSAPNPFVQSTKIRYGLKQEASVTLTVFNVLGQSLRTLVDQKEVPGGHMVVWDGRDDLGSRVSPGVYWYRLRAGSYTSVKRTIVLR
jgi:hypothetical protein